MLEELAQDLLLQVKLEKRTHQIVEKLAHYPFSSLKEELPNDERKKSFWINIYNAYFLILRKEQNLSKPAIYRNRVIHIANKMWSLDDIEHGILRRFRYKYSLGYLKNPFVSKLIKTLAVQHVDYRIHFALNCGAKSCPPIAFYRAESINEQLDLATESFLNSDIVIDSEKSEIWISRLFKWYFADFGGKSGIKQIVQDHISKPVDPFQFRYSPYNWEEALDNFTPEGFPS